VIQLVPPRSVALRDAQAHVSFVVFEIAPRPESRRCEVREARRLRGEQVWIAALTRGHGAWEAIRDEDGHRYGLRTSALTGNAEARFHALLASLRA